MSRSGSFVLLLVSVLRMLVAPMAGVAGVFLSVSQLEGAEPCQSCHDDVPLSGSVHEGFECEACHAGRESFPHPETLPMFDCSSCHSEESEDFASSLHAGADVEDNGFTCVNCHGSHQILSGDLERSSTWRATVHETCARCHGNVQFVIEQPGLFSTRPYFAYQESVHGRAIQRGDFRAAICTDCHNAHAVVRPNDPRSPIFRSRIPSTCGKCHPSVYGEYRESIHGRAAAAGITASPVCTSCHGIHSIRAPVDPESSVSARAVARSTCAQCHQSEQLSKEFGVPRERVESYYDSYHGLESSLGSVRTANCASCHGVHNILPSSDPRSTIHPGRLPETCGRCHPGASENFARGRIHLVSAAFAGPEAGGAPPEDPFGTRVIRAVREIYVLLIVIVIGGMLLHNLLDFAVRARRTIQEVGATHLRLTRAERLQHGLLVISFLTLAVSGFALKFPEAWWVRLLFYGSPELRANLHRVAAVVMTLLSGWHLGWLVFAQRGREQRRALRPRFSDLRELVTSVGRNLGLRVAPEPANRFGYVEKAEYWALVWGTTIMAVTGTILWAEGTALRYLPKWGLDVAEVVHYYEAWLASLAILVWHVYFTVLRPGNRSLRWAWLTGKLAEEEWREEHPGEYGQISGGSQELPCAD